MKFRKIFTIVLAAAITVSAAISVLADEIDDTVLEFDENGNLILPEGWLTMEEMQEKFGYTVEQYTTTELPNPASFKRNSPKEKNAPANDMPELSFDENGELILPEGWLTMEEMQKKFGYTVEQYNMDDTKDFLRLIRDSRSPFAALGAVLTSSYSYANNNISKYYPLQDYDYCKMDYNFTGKSGAVRYSDIGWTIEDCDTIYAGTRGASDNTGTAAIYLIGSMTKNGISANGVILEMATAQADKSTVTYSRKLEGDSVKMYSYIQIRPDGDGCISGHMEMSAY